MKKIIVSSLFFLLISAGIHSTAQTVLTADGPGNTYELINSVLAPGYNAVENPECVHPEFGRHITEVMDTDLNQFVFEFFTHVTPDNDRCINVDRQRMEIKTYESSPANLKGTLGETVTYKWRFKIPVGFRPSSSFTHIHQVKAVGGDEDQPIFTLTARKGTPSKLELIYVASGTSGTVKHAIVNLSEFEGIWVEATEQLFLAANGSYQISIRRVSDNVQLLSYSNNNITTIRSDNDFVRPKWGIYRSLNTPADLRDESIRFNSFSIQEGNIVLPVSLTRFDAVGKLDHVALTWATATAINSMKFEVERSGDGIHYRPLATLNTAGNSNTIIHYNYEDRQPLSGNNYYRLKQTDLNGQFIYSDVRLVNFLPGAGLFRIYPNPVVNSIWLDVPMPGNNTRVMISDAAGKQIMAAAGSLVSLKQTIERQLPFIKQGIYFIRLQDDGRVYNERFYKQ